MCSALGIGFLAAYIRIVGHGSYLGRQQCFGQTLLEAVATEYLTFNGKNDAMEKRER